MKAEIISVGTELLLGSTINTDAADVAVLLSEYGIDVHWQTVVGDNPGRVTEAVSRAKGRADLIITTGGLWAPPATTSRSPPWPPPSAWSLRWTKAKRPGCAISG